jgi:NAD(P)-dependent dehydrogenase (short-subunit alcohol dehydrogenase family)
MTSSLFPLLKNPSHDGDLTKIVSISARVGSINDNKIGGWYSYRMSKAALNMFTRTTSIEMKR